VKRLNKSYFTSVEKLSELRNQIDHIHLQMANLICSRLKIAEEIWTLKKNLNLNTTDAERELQLLNLFDHNSNFNESEKKVLRAVFESTIIETKKYLNDKK
jgi:chorismate mutase